MVRQGRRFIIGEIYKITNMINGRVYIGATKRTLNDRKREHLKTYNDSKSRMYEFKIYKAMRKYGVENFLFESLEKCQTDKLDEREKYYIEKYDSKNNGYNEAIGGKGKPLWTDKQVEACKILYDNHWLLKDISDLFNSNPSTVGKKLKEKYNIDTKYNSSFSFGKSIYGIKENQSVYFDSISDAGRYIMANNLSDSKNLPCIISKISNALVHSEYSAYGFKWFYKDAS